MTDYQQSTINPIATVIDYDEEDPDDIEVQISETNNMSKSHRLPNKSSK